METKLYHFLKKDLAQWTSQLKNKYQVWLPVTEDGQTDFWPEPELAEVDLEYRQGHLGIKKIFFPAQEVLFEVDKGQAKAPGRQKPVAVIGCHPADLMGIQRLDESFGQAPADFYWERRRQDALLVGITPIAGHKYFTDSLADFPLQFDLFFHVKPKTFWLVETGSDLGKKLVKNNRLFKPTNQRLAQKKTTPKLDPLLADPHKLARLIENSAGSKIWKDLEKICLNCGICTYVCPLCYCFSVKDKIAASGDSCQRCRYWDACTLARFARISSGFNFRGTPGKRYYNWYFHKFVRAPRERGKIDCVGCHRCIDFCPAGIDFRKIIQQLTQEQKQRK